MAIKGAIPMGHDDVFPYGCFGVGEVQAMRDFDRSTKDQAVQAVDRDTGVLVWTVDVVDADPEARERTVRVQAARAGAAGPAGGDAGGAVPAGRVRRPDRHAVRGDHGVGPGRGWRGRSGPRGCGPRAGFRPGPVTARRADGRGADGVADRAAQRRVGRPARAGPGRGRGPGCPAPSRPLAVPVWVRRVTTAAVLAVAAVAAVASYEHMRALAALAGEGWRSWLLPVSVDGLAVAASMTMLVRRRAGQPAGVLPWAALLLGLGASLAANVAAAEPTVVGRLVAAWPPVGLLLSYELLMQQHGTRGGPGVQTVRPGAVQPLDEGLNDDRHDD